MEDDDLPVRVLVDDHPGAADLGAGPGSGRHGDDRSDSLRIDAGPVVADVFEIPDRTGLADHQRDALAGIERRPAADGDHAIVPTRSGHLDPGLDVAAGRVLLHVVEHRHGHIDGSQHVRHHREFGETRIGHDQRPLDGVPPTHLTELGDTSGTNSNWAENSTVPAPTSDQPTASTRTG